MQALSGAAVSFSISPASNPKKLFLIDHAFSASPLGFVEYSHPVKSRVKSRCNSGNTNLWLVYHGNSSLGHILSHTHLITAVEPIRLGPPGGPVAIKTVRVNIDGVDRYCMYTSEGKEHATVEGTTRSSFATIEGHRKVIGEKC